MATSRLRLVSGQAYLYTGSEGIYQVITGQAQALTGDSKVSASGSLQVTGSMFLKNEAAAPTPGAAEAVLYARAGTLYFKNSGGSETAVGGGGGSVGGSNTQVQFNDGGSAFGGDSGLTYNKITNTLSAYNLAIAATNDLTFKLKDNSAGALNISAGAANNRWTFKTGDNAETLHFWDNVSASFGDLNAPDFTILHDGTDSKILNKTGQLVLSGNNGIYVTGSTSISGSLTLVGDINADRNTPRSIFSDVVSITVGGASSTITLPGDLAVNGGDITTTQTTANIFTSNATTANVLTSATDLSIGTTTGTAWLKNANVYFSGSVYVSGSTRLGDAAADVTQVTGSFRSRQVTGSIHTVDGTTAYLAAGSGVTTTYSNSTGQWTIAATGGSSTVTGSFNDIGSKFITTASVSIAGAKGFTYDANSAGTDVFFFVSGSIAGGNNSTALFGGRAVVSGSLTTQNDLTVSGNNILTSRSTFNIVNNTATTINFAGAGTDISIGSAQSGNTYVKHNLRVSGALYYGNELYAAGGVADKQDTTAAADINGYRYVRFSGFAVDKICNIPTAASSKYRVITILNDDDTSNVTVTSESGSIVGNGNADTTYILLTKKWIEIVSDGTAWLIVCGGQLPAQN